MRPSSRHAYARLLVLKHVVVHSVATPPRPILKGLLNGWSEEDCRKFDGECKAQAEATVAGMHKLGLWKYASPNERAFLTSYGIQMDEYTHKAAGWRMECAGMIMWALGLIDSWPKIDEGLSHDLLKNVPIRKAGFFSKYPGLRPYGEMSPKRDLVEFWHWRVRTRQLAEAGHSFNPDENMRRMGLNTRDDIVRFLAKRGYEKGDLPEMIDEDFVFLRKAFRSLSESEYQMAASIIMERHYALNWLCGMAPGNRWDETPTDT